MASQEADNSEEMEYVRRILNSNELLKQCLPVMVASAKALAARPNSKERFLAWTSSNERLIDAIGAVRTAVADGGSSASDSAVSTSSVGSFCRIPDFDVLRLNEGSQQICCLFLERLKIKLEGVVSAGYRVYWFE